MELDDMIMSLYKGDKTDAWEILAELESISEREDILYPYLYKFIDMIRNEKYVVRLRGFRMLCKQAKWDKDNKINEFIEDILIALHDEKPTAVRHALQYMRYIVQNKKELNDIIKHTVLSIDCSKFKDTMRPLILKDIQNLVNLIEE